MHEGPSTLSTPKQGENVVEQKGERAPQIDDIRDIIRSDVKSGEMPLRGDDEKFAPDGRLIRFSLRVGDVEYLYAHKGAYEGLRECSETDIRVVRYEGDMPVSAGETLAIFNHETGKWEAERYNSDTKAFERRELP